MTTEYTPNIRLAKPDFRSGPWGQSYHDNMDAIDAAIFNSLAAANIEVWANSTAYTIGEITVDTTVSPPTFWVCATAHTSPASPTTFAANRAAFPTRWTSLTFGITPRGEWQNSEDYGYYDIAYDSTLGIVGLCLVPHTSNSSGDIQDDSANWVFIVDLPSVGTTPATNISFDNSGAALPGAPANVQTAIVALDTRVDNAATVVADHETRLDTAEADITSIESVNSSQASTISDHETRIDDLETDMTAAESRLDAHDATIAGLGSGFAATTAMVFFQASAPTGWTKQTTHNDKAIRIVSGTGGSSGGSSAFSTVFGKTATDATTLTTSTIPAHTHTVPYYGSSGSSTGPAEVTAATFAGNATSGSNGSGGSHTHPMDIRVQYLDCIICTKN